MTTRVQAFVAGGGLLFVLAAFFALLPALQDATHVHALFRSLMDVSHRHTGYFVALSALMGLIEAIFAVSFYFPGSFVIVLVVILFAGEPMALVLCLAAVWVGVMAGIGIDYYFGYRFRTVVHWLGHRGMLDRIAVIYRRQGKWAVYIAALHPNYLGLLFTFLGLTGVAFIPSFGRAALGLLLSIGVWFAIIRLTATSAPTGQDSFLYGVAAVLALWGTVEGARAVAKIRPVLHRNDNAAWQTRRSHTH